MVSAERNHSLRAWSGPHLRLPSGRLLRALPELLSLVSHGGASSDSPALVGRVRLYPNDDDRGATSNRTGHDDTHDHGDTGERHDDDEHGLQG